MSKRIVITWFDGEYDNTISVILEDAVTDNIRINKESFEGDTRP